MNIQPIRNSTDYASAVRRLEDIEYELAYEETPELSIELDLVRGSMLEYELKPKLSR
jgi:hypothetical protein